MRNLSKRGHRAAALLAALLAGATLLISCGGKEEEGAGSGATDEGAWAGRDSSYTEDYLLSPEKSICFRLSDDGKSYEAYDSASGHRCGTLDFVERGGKGLSKDAGGVLEFSDRDGDGYGDFGVPLANGALVWYKVDRSADPAKEDNIFTFLELQARANPRDEN